MSVGTGFFGLLVVAAGPIAVRAVAALGFSALTFVGVSGIVSALVSTAQSNWAAMPAGVLQLASLSGIPTGLGMVFGAYAALFAIRAAAGFKKFILK